MQNEKPPRPPSRVWLMLPLLVLAACGGGGGADPAPPATHSISGAVTGSATSGVTVTLSGVSSATTTTGAGGAYTFSGLAAGSYTVTPSLAGHTFTPASLAVTVGGADVTGRSFVASAVPPPTHAISGAVSGAVTSGVTVTLSGASSATTTTGANGAYSFTGLADGSYTVTPSLAGHTFTPASLAVTVAGADVTGRSFVAAAVPPPTHAISGAVSGAVTSGVTVTLAGAQAASTTTDASGSYTFPGLADGDYTVTPSLAGYAFTPASLAVTLAGADAPGMSFVAATIAPALPFAPAYSAGYDCSAAVKPDGTLWTWGSGSVGCLGDGTAAFSGTSRPAPAQIGSGFAAVHCGGACAAVKADGTLWGWGGGYNGASPDSAFPVGDGTYGTIRITPVLLSGAGFAQVSVSYTDEALSKPGHANALRADGSLWAWGHSTVGQVGLGSTSSVYSPTAVGTDYAAVASGGFHTLAVKADGSLWAWGDNAAGQLGDGTTAGATTPRLIGSGYAKVAAGRLTSAAIKSDGTLWTWGSSNFSGLLGLGDTANRQVPTLVGPDYVDVSVGDNFMCGVKTDETLWCWGYGQYGELGNNVANGNNVVKSPAQVGAGFVSVKAGKFHVLAQKSDGTLWGWGKNASGEVGDGTRILRATPTAVTPF